jgi:cytochrome c oxidase subunit IV
MKISRENVKWAARLFSILLLVAVADALVAMFMHRPFPWTVIIPGLLPLLVSVFVILPMIREKMTTRRRG